MRRRRRYENRLGMCGRARRDARALVACRLSCGPVDADGLTPGPHHWRDIPPKLIYITPSHQYPRGAVMSLDRRLALIVDASRYANV